MRSRYARDRSAGLKCLLHDPPLLLHRAIASLGFFAPHLYGLFRSVHGSPLWTRSSCPQRPSSLPSDCPSTRPKPDAYSCIVGPHRTSPEVVLNPNSGVTCHTPIPMPKAWLFRRSQRCPSTRPKPDAYVPPRGAMGAGSSRQDFADSPGRGSSKECENSVETIYWIVKSAPCQGVVFPAELVAWASSR